MDIACLKKQVYARAAETKAEQKKKEQLSSMEKEESHSTRPRAQPLPLKSYCSPVSFRRNVEGTVTSTAILTANILRLFRKQEKILT